MKNYQESDYALNKYSEGIVYKYADGSKHTVMLEDYLAANPHKTAEDFAQLKAWSDNQYHEQIIVENRTGRLDVTISGLEETQQLSTAPLDAELIHKADGQAAIKAAKLLFSGNDLTEIQRRRFVLHFMKGLSYRQIAEQEGVFFTSVAESVNAAAAKLKKYFDKF